MVIWFLFLLMVKFKNSFSKSLYEKQKGGNLAAQIYKTIPRMSSCKARFR